MADILSHYEIVEKLGEGGMGVVSLARDTRLGRLVALKRLRLDAVACGREQRERFLQEARTASSLNHPNIITIYDIDSDGESDIIAMEYVKGQTLDGLIQHRPLPLSDALEFGVQIARALAAAHEAGIVHRDIKPANIMATPAGLVKVLDFGLAKLQQRAPVATDADTASGGNAAPRTAEGIVSGTLYYMSPEQAEGREVDARTDIFAFGCVLYEMLTGRRAFGGESVAAVLASILREEPAPLRQLNPQLPAELERIVKRCLRKDPRRRWQHMADLGVALEEIREEAGPGALAAPATGAAGETRTGPNWAMLAFAALVLAAVGFGWWRNLRPAGPGPASKSALTRLTSDPGLTTFPALSPDGSLVAYASDRAGGGNLDVWVQQVAGGDPIRLTSGPADEYEPAFSPDGSRVVFRSEAEGGGIYMVSALGGEPRLLVREGRGAAFSPAGDRIAYTVGSPGVGGAFSFGESSLFTIAPGGGEPKRRAADLTAAHHPAWTADGKHLLFIGARTQEQFQFDLFALPMDGGALVETGILKALRQQSFGLSPAPFAIHGDSLILSLGTGDTTNLWRARLRRFQFELAGPPEQLTFGTGLERLASVSKSGRLAFSSGQENTDLWELPADVNRGTVKGEERQLTRDAARDSYPHLAANGSRIAFISNRQGNDDVWTMDAATGKASALLSTPDQEFYPKLSRDGTFAAFGSIAGRRRAVIAMSTAGGVASKLCDDCGMVRDLSGDGSKILLQAGPPSYVALMDVATRKVTPLYKHERHAVNAPKLSPDEKWTAFQTVENATARSLHVAPFRAGGAPVAASEWIRVTDGKFLDRNPYWSPDGGLLYFLSERDSFRCIWALRLHPATRKPAGEPFAVAHFHNAMRSLVNIDAPGQISVSVGPDRLVYATGELTGNIWSTQLR